MLRRRLRLRARPYWPFDTPRAACLPVLALVYVATVLVTWAAPGVAPLSILPVNGLLLLYDWRGFLTGADLIVWAEAPEWAQALWILVMVGGWLAPPIYLWRTMRGCLRRKAIDRQLLAWRIEQQERDLGIGRSDHAN